MEHLKRGMRQATHAIARGAVVGLLAMAWMAPPQAAVAAGLAKPAQAHSYADAALLRQIAAQLGRPHAVTAHITQTQTLAALKAPLVSTGRFLFARERGVIWQMQTPTRTTYVIGEKAITEIDADGRRIQRNARSMAGVGAVSRMMRAMIGGDLSALYSQFDVRASGNASQWQLQLTPNQPQLAQAIARLDLSGGALLRQMSIVAANGDVTRIEFSHVVALDTLSAADSALFGDD